MAKAKWSDSAPSLIISLQTECDVHQRMVGCVLPLPDCNILEFLWISKGVDPILMLVIDGVEKSINGHKY